MTFPVIHLLVDGKSLCGLRGKLATVPPHQAKHVTCQRCLAALQSFTREAKGSL